MWLHTHTMLFAAIRFFISSFFFLAISCHSNCRIPSFCGCTRFCLCPRLRWGTRGTLSCHSLSSSSYMLSPWSTTMPSTGTSSSASGHTTTAQGLWEATMTCCTSTAEGSSPVQVNQHKLGCMKCCPAAPNKGRGHTCSERPRWRRGETSATLGFLLVHLTASLNSDESHNTLPATSSVISMSPLHLHCRALW